MMDMRDYPSAFEGPLLGDFATWGGAALTVGYAAGFSWGMLYNNGKKPDPPVDEVWLAGRGAGILVCFALPIICFGHLFAELGL
jgi:hypothetical protein